MTRHEIVKGVIGIMVWAAVYGFWGSFLKFLVYVEEFGAHIV